MLREPRHASMAAVVADHAVPRLRRPEPAMAGRGLQSRLKPHRNRALIGSAGVAQG
jgi:hypothetical protein